MLSSLLSRLFSPALREDARRFVVLALPVFLAQVAQLSMGFVDTVVAGRAGAADMAAVAVGASFWMPGVLFGQGLLMAITPLVAQTLGAGEKGGARDGVEVYLGQGLWLALALGLLLMAVFGAVALALGAWRALDPRLAALAAGYLGYIAWGAPGMMLYCMLRAFLEGHGRTRPAMVAGFVGLALNIPLNFVFVFGLLGMPALGGAGCGLASAIVCWVMAGVMLLPVRRLSPGFPRREPVIARVMLRLARIGLPGAFALLMEVSVFAVIAVLLAPLGAAVVAGHQVALNVSGMVFIVPLSLGSAATILVGSRLGRGDQPGARRAHRVALGLGVGLACVSAALVLLFRYPLARVYTDNPDVIALAALLMVYNALYQISDAVQMTTICSLRGYNDTRAIFAMTFVSYWLIALPLGCLLGLTPYLAGRPLGAVGFWIAIIVGLSCAAVLSLLRLRALERLTPDALRAKISR